MDRLASKSKTVPGHPRRAASGRHGGGAGGSRTVDRARQTDAGAATARAGGQPPFRCWGPPDRAPAGAKPAASHDFDSAKVPGHDTRRRCAADRRGGPRHRPARRTLPRGAVTPGRATEAIHALGVSGVQARVIAPDGRQSGATSGTADLNTGRPVSSGGYFPAGTADQRCARRRSPRKPGFRHRQRGSDRLIAPSRPWTRCPRPPAGRAHRQGAAGPGRAMTDEGGALAMTWNLHAGDARRRSWDRAWHGPLRRHRGAAPLGRSPRRFRNTAPPAQAGAALETAPA